MIIFLDRMRLLFSGSMLFSESPLDDNIHGRLNGAWFGAHGVQTLALADIKLNFNASDWEGLTGNFVGDKVLGTAISNSPFSVAITETYSFFLEAISGPSGAKQIATVRSSSGWEGERIFIRAADTPEGITSAVWKEISTFFIESGAVTTTDTSFTTIIIHPVALDTLERIRFFVNGIEVSGTRRGIFEVALTVQNIAGTVSIIGETILIQHKTSGVISIQSIISGSDILLQVRGPLATFNWVGEIHFNEGV